LIEASKLPSEGVGTTTSLTAALELIASLEPENEAQAALAVHVACLHTASLNVLSRTHSIGERNMIAMATACAKLEHAFHSAIETYYRVKRGVTQIVRVERVELQPGAQAVIGVVARE
jgi:hypothetical protein